MVKKITICFFLFIFFFPSNSYLNADVAKNQTPNLDEIIKNIKKFINPDGNKTPTEIIRGSMDFVCDYSYHCDNYRPDARELITEMYLAYVENKEKPCSTCGPRSLTMLKILQFFDIKAWRIQFFDIHPEQFKGHRMIEAYNPETKKVEIWDPDGEKTYVDIQGSRLSAKDILIGGLDYYPKHRDRQIVGWHDEKVIYPKSYFNKAYSMQTRNDLYYSKVFIKREYYGTNKELMNYLKAWKSEVSIIENLHNP
jgi:hypothetical protein